MELDGSQAIADPPTVDEPATSIEPAKRKPRLLLTIFVSLVLVALVVMLANITGTRADIAALHNLGVPTDVSFVNPPDSENAAILYESGIQLDHSLQNPEGRFSAFEQVGFGPYYYPADHMPVLIQGAKRRQPVIDMYRKGSLLPHCVYEAASIGDDSTKDYQPPYFGYSALIEVEDSLIGAAQMDMMLGDRRKMMQDLGYARNIPRQVAQNSGREAFDASCMLTSDFLRNWVSCMKANKDNAQVVADGYAMIHEQFTLPSIRKAAVGDFPYLLDVWKRAQAKPFEYKVHARMSSDTDYKDNSFFMRQAVNQAIHQWRLTFEAMPQNDEDWRGFQAAFEKGSDGMKSRWPGNELLTNPFQGYARLGTRWARTQAEYRLALCVAELLKTRIETHSYPDKLPDLGDNSIDPFTGQRFTYKRAGSGFVVYSVGPDGVGSHGPAPNGRFRLTDDIVDDFGD